MPKGTGLVTGVMWGVCSSCSQLTACVPSKGKEWVTEAQAGDLC